MIYYFAIYDILLHERMLACASEDCFCMMRWGIWRCWTGLSQQQCCRATSAQHAKKGPGLMKRPGPERIGDVADVPQPTQSH